MNYEDALREKPDKYLLEMILINNEQYEAEALQIARHILRERNVDLNNYETDIEFIGKGILSESKKEISFQKKSKLTAGYLLLAGGIAIILFNFFSNIETPLIAYPGFFMSVYGVYSIISYYIIRKK